MGEKSPVLIREEGGKIHLVHLVDEMMKIKGLGVFNPSKLLSDLEIGDNVEIGQKTCNEYLCDYLSLFLA